MWQATMGRCFDLGAALRRQLAEAEGVSFGQPMKLMRAKWNNA